MAIWMTASISSLVGALMTGGLVGDFMESAEDGREVESWFVLLLFMYWIGCHGLGKDG